jgi:hypothetical protein
VKISPPPSPTPTPLTQKMKDQQKPLLGSELENALYVSKKGDSNNHDRLQKRFVLVISSAGHAVNWCPFHQHFMSSFCAKILLPKNYKPKL